MAAMSTIVAATVAAALFSAYQGSEESKQARRDATDAEGEAKAQQDALIKDQQAQENQKESTDQALQVRNQAVAAQKRQAQAALGRRDTILTSPLGTPDASIGGVGSTPGPAKSLLGM
jgi:hypothetical protein